MVGQCRVSLAIVGLTIAVLGGACASPPLPVPIPVATPAATPEPSKPRTAGDALVNEAVQQRASLGLPAGEPFVRELLGDRAAVARGEASGYGFPLTATELTLLESRALGVDRITAIVARYAAAHDDTWAGHYVDRSTGTVIARFTGDLERHEAALRRDLPADARLELMAANWTLAALEAAKRRVRADEAWFGSINATLTATAIDVVSNRTVIDVSSADPDIERIVRSHFGEAGELEILVGRFGPGPWTGGRGELLVVARDTDGRPVEMLDCEIRPDEPGAWGEEGRSTDEDGTCRFRGVGATGVTVVLRGRVGDQVLEFGRGRIELIDGGSVTLVITVTRPERPD